MTNDELERALRETLEDLRMSRGERKALRERLLEAEIDEERRRAFRSRAFELAHEFAHDEPSAVLRWLEEVVSALDPPPQRSRVADISRAHFSPGEECLSCIVELIREARETLDICVFTITDDRISSEILDAHRRGRGVRIITDDDKAHDEGSDIFRLERAGVAVRVDRTPNHMHHKFMVVDGRVLLTGSYNWTRSAAHFNHENVLATSEARIVAAFGAAFERIWRELA
jgi:cardiolipin hydrolase